MAFRMCSMRNCQDLSADIHSASQNGLAELRINAVPRHHIDREAIEAPLQVLLYRDEIEESDWTIEIDEYIDVAFGKCFIPGNGAKQCKLIDAEVFAKMLPLALQSAEDFIAIHGHHPFPYHTVLWLISQP